MSENEKHEINLQNENNHNNGAENPQNQQNENQNPPLIDYMEPKNNKNNFILFGIVAVIGVLILIVVGYYIFGYFTSRQPKPASFDNNKDEIAEVEIIPEESEDTQEESFSVLPGYMTPEEDDYAGIIVAPQEIANYQQNKAPSAPNAPQTPTQSNNTNGKTELKPIISTDDSLHENIRNVAAFWKANDYQPGEIKGSTHVVIIGDTLWEISEGKYGEGQQWKKVKDANNVKNLPNGNPLIIPGQELKLP